MLDGVNRFLSLIEGKISLDFQGDTEIIQMEPDDVLEFSGDIPVHCTGKCTDFNLMCKGKEGFMECPEGDFTDELSEDQLALYFAREAVFLTVDGQEISLEKGDSLLTDRGQTVKCNRGENIISCIMNME